MAEEVVAAPATPAPIAAPVKKTPKTKVTKAKGDKKPKTSSTHPPTSDMVKAAVKALKERNGSSLPAIKKYIATEFKVDIVKLAPFIKKSLKSMVEKKALVQTKGVGASGSFKLPAAEKKAAPKKSKDPKAEKKATKPKAPKADKKDTKSKAPKAEKKATKPKVPKAEKKSKASTAEKKATKPKALSAKKPAAKRASGKK